ncbi:hypothetical protein V6D40_05555 [Corynebacterium sp. Q4381]|uniref:hypothetical protein n=1 Tax=Corynebacterium sp. Marseille-Q4381 TaxID=3121597 RepID=UPI002FE6AF93
MKRFNKTVVSLATAGALGFGVAPIAFAQDAQFGDLPVTEGEGALAVDANYPENPVDNTPGTTVNLPEGATWDESIAPAPNAPATSIDELTKAQPEAQNTTAPLANVVCTDGDGNRVTYLRHADGLNYVKDGYDTTGALPGAAGAYRSYADLQADQSCDLVEGGDVQGAVTPGEVTTDPADIAKAVAAVVGAGVGAAIIINGVKYFLNKDGKTLVETPERVHMDATPEEKAKSEQLIKENAAEINNANNAQNERGIAAATGVNKIPAALMTLLLASVLAAAAFVFGRRQLV